VSKKSSSSRVRLADIAKAAGVTRPVAGKVLLGTGGNIRVSEAAAQRIREAAERLNYRPNSVARQLAGGRSNLLGILMSDRDNKATVQRLFATEREAHRRGYRCVIGQVHDVESTLAGYLEDFEDRGVDGVLHLDTAPDAVAKRLADVPRAVFAVKPSIPGAHYVELDRAEASRMAVRHLQERGHRLCGLVISSIKGYTASERQRGFVEAHEAMGLSVTPPVWMPGPSATEHLEAATEALDVLVRQKGCTGIVAGNDRWAVALVKAALRSGLNVPRDVAVVGFNNLDIATVVEPQLTTIDQQHDVFAPAAMEMLIKLIEHGPLPLEQRGVTIPPRLVVRASS